jgi:protein-tyrosine-phosphatase
MAHALLSAICNTQGTVAQIASAGTSPGGFPLPAETQDALRRVGFDSPGLGSYRSRELTAEMLEWADLVLGLAREHVREVVVRIPAAWDKSFTLKELVRRGAAVGPRRGDEALAAWLAKVGEGRTRIELLGDSETDDVIDPAGGLPSGFLRTALEIQTLCASLAGLLWP